MPGQTTEEATGQVAQGTSESSALAAVEEPRKPHGVIGPTRGRSGGGRFVPTLAGVERDYEAARLRAMGWSLSKIAKHLGYAHHGKAHEGIQRAFKRIPSEGVEVRRQQQQALIDHLKIEALGVLARPHVAHSQGRVVREGCPGLDYAGQPQHDGCTWGKGGQYCDGPAVLDDGPKLQAISTIKALLDREAKLHGLDSPIRVEQTDVGVAIILEGVSLDDL